MMEERKATTGHLLALLTIQIWGTTFISTKILLGDFTPIEILFFRFIIGYIALCLIYSRPLRTKSFKEELLFIAAGLCGVTLYFLVENIALVYTLASNVGVIVSIAPFFTALAAHFFLEEEKLNAQFMTGFLIALAGIVLIGLNGSFNLQLNPIGDLLAFLAPALWAIYSVLMRKISALQHHTTGATRRVFFMGCCLCCLRFYCLISVLAWPDYSAFPMYPTFFSWDWEPRHSVLSPGTGWSESLER